MTRDALLKKLQSQISEREREQLGAGELLVGAFNRSLLLEMLAMQSAPEGNASDSDVQGLIDALDAFLAREMATQPEGWKWIRLSCLYLSFVARKPLHPPQLLGIRQRVGQDGETIWLCPQRSDAPDATCRYCVCTNERFNMER